MQLKLISYLIFLVIFSGLAFASSAVSVTCYQESAEVQSCHQSINGRYTYQGGTGEWTSPLNVSDSNWNTYGIPIAGFNGVAFINYSKAPGIQINNVTWLIKDGSNESAYNISIPRDCIENNTNYLILKIIADNTGNVETSYFCQNNTGYKLIFNNTLGADHNRVYEEALYWDYNVSIDNCTNSSGIPSNATAYQFYFSNSNGAATEVNLTTNLVYLGNTFVTSSDLTNNFKYCIYPSWLNITGNISLQYEYNGILYTYDTVNSYFDNVTNYINLTVETSGTTDVTATVYDEVGNELEGAYIYPQKYEDSTGNYISIGQFATNFEGKTVIPMTLNTQKYKFLLYYPFGTLKETTNPTYIYATTISFYIQTSEDIMDDYFTSEEITSSLTYDNSTMMFSHLFSDPNNEVEQGCLDIYLLAALGNQSYSSSCISGSSGTTQLPIANVSGTTYLAKSSVYLRGNKIPMQSLSHNFPSAGATDTIGQMGLLADFLLTTVMSFIFFFSIPLAVLLIPLPTVMLSTIGVIAVDPAIAWGMEVAALVLAIIINRRS